MTTLPMRRTGGRCFSALAIALAVATLCVAAARAQDYKPQPGWAIDPRSGCKVWDEFLEPGEIVRWSGECPKGVAEGRGTVEWVLQGQDEERYEGEMRGGKMNGSGTLSFPNGMRYEGQFKDNDFHGTGKLTYGNGDVYEGEFADDDRSGKGTFTMKDGRRYVGEWKKDLPDGQGTLTRRDGRTFSGKWKMGCLNDGGTKAALIATPRECKIY